MLLVVNSSNLTCRDLVVQCGNGWKVLDVKLHLHSVHPEKPEPRKQKLIFAGRLLDDSQFIEDIVRTSPIEGNPILHLVCHVSNSTTEETASSQTPTYGVPFSPGGLRLQDAPSFNTENSQPSQFSFWVNAPESHLLAQQITWWHQAYTQQYRNQYAQYLCSLGYYWPQPVFGSTATAAPAVVPETPATVPPVEEPQAAPDQPRLEQVNEANDDLNPARDWLDWMYIGTRVAVLLAVIFYYSSVSRVLMVVFIALAVYIYQNDYVRPVQREVNNNVNDGAVPAEQDAGTDQQEVRNPEDAVLRPDNPSAFSIAINILSTFFASLIPEVPAPEAL